MLDFSKLKKVASGEAAVVPAVAHRMDDSRDAGLRYTDVGCQQLASRAVTGDRRRSMVHHRTGSLHRR